MKAWSHLPNAHHIDWVLASLNENPEWWDAARVSAWDAVWDAVWVAARDAARNAAWDAAYEAAKSATIFAAKSAASDATGSVARISIEALIAWDDCDQFLNMSYEKLQIWAVLSEDPRAVLLLPMIYVKEKLNEQSMVTSA